MINAADQPVTLDRDALLSLYRQMVMIRAFEEQVMDLYGRALIPGIAHVSIGQEAIAVGVCVALRRDDYITSTHRGHGHCLAKGARPDKMFAELFGKVEGYCRGKGGSMHIADPDTGNLGANAIVGGSLAIATGAALSAKYRKNGQVAVCFFGDGALNQGLLLESMNMAAIWQLPVIYVCENNQYGEYTPTERVTAGNISQRGEALGVRSAAVDGMDVLAVYDAARQMVEQARAGSGPGFLVCRTYRYFGHGMSDRDRVYRTRDEEDSWRQYDPVARLSAQLLASETITQAELDNILANVTRDISAAVEYGMAAPFPDPDEVNRHVYAS
ncbi:MAG: thiamine pyrophosphate-dependent dehydrogenase E1 component subunit alpha [Anaerolineae bacterium]|nr:thiamine pyrophosphate-dependent dehydrogenase E1 component subunit alpha [Anaerolineae bacterium]